MQNKLNFRTCWLKYAFCTLSLLFSLSIGNAWGADVTQTYTLDKDDNGNTVTTGDVSWAVGSGAITASSSNMKLTGTITVTLPSGATLKSVSLTKSNSWGSGAKVIFASGSTSLNEFTSNGTFTLTSNKTDLTYTFTKGGTASKNAWVKTISVTYTPGSGSNPSLTANPTSLSWGTTVLQGSTPGTKTVSISGSNLTNGTLTISANNGYSVSPTSISVNGTLSATNLTITPPSTSTTGAKNGTLTISGGGLASNVTVSLSMTVVTAYAVNWFVNGQSYTTGSPTRFVASGGTIETFPTPPSSCDNTKVFVGWSETNIGSTETNTAPTLITTATTISATKNYYAVFAKRGDFTRITGPSSLTANMQLVIVSNKYGTAITNANTPSYATAPTESSSKVTPTDAMIWLLTGSASGWRISAPNGRLLGYASNPSSNNSTTATLAANNTLSTWKIGQNSYTSDVLYISNYTTNSCALEAGSATSAWVVYNSSSYSSNQYCALKVYGASFTKYITQCCTQLGTINGSITLTQSGTSVTIKNWGYTPANTGDESNISTYTVYLSSDDFAHSTSQTCTPANRVSTGVTFSNLAYDTNYKIKIAATAEGFCPISDVTVGTINSVSTQTFALSCADPTAAAKGTFDGTNQRMPITWTSGAGKVDVCYSTNSSKPGATPGSGYTVISDQTSSPVNIDASGFAASTNYYVWVRSVCSATTKSDWVAITGNYFTLPTHTLTVNTNGGSGTGTVDLSPNNTTVVEGRTVELTASANSGSTFASWAVSGTGAGLSSTTTNPTTFTMGTANATVTATFNIAAYFPNRKTLFIEAGKDGSAWDASACVKAWFRDGDAGGEAVATQWLANAGDGKKIFATVIPSTGSYRYMTIQRFDPANNCSSHWNDNGAVSKADDGGSNVVKTTCSTNSCVSWSPSALSLYLRGEIDSWAGNLATLTDQNDGIWTASYNNYTATTTSLYFRITDSYSNMHGNGNTALSGMIVGSTYNITASYDVTSGTLTMSKDFVKGTVSFDLQGHGSAISALTNVTAGSTISAPVTPTDGSYIFGGWYKEPGCTNAWDFTNDVVNESMTLYAKWYQVTLVVKDDAGTTLTGSGKPTLIRTGASLTATTAGSYVFKDIQITNGTGSLSATNVTNPTINSVSSDITVTATFWKPRTVTKGTGTGISTFTISATSVAYNGSVTVTCAAASTHKNPWTLTVTPSDGATYTESGSDGSITISNITKDITVDLAYTAKETYTMTFNTKSGYGTVTGGKIDATDLSYSSGTVTNTLMEGQTLTFPTITSFTADDCSTTFVGWSTDPSCATAPTIKAGDELVLSGASGSTTYYAVYSQSEEGGGDDFDPSEAVDGDFYITEKYKGYYATNTIADNVISTVTNKDNASKYHIESVIVSGDRRFILSTLVNATTMYLVMATTGSGKQKQNTLTTTDTKNDATKFEITEGAEGTNGTWQVGYNETRGLMYRTYTPSGQPTVYRFGNYAFSNASSTGYSLLEFEPAASKTYTTNPTCTETFTVTLTGGEGASVDVTGGNVKYNGGTAARFAENDAVSISATPSAGYTFTSWSISKEGGGSVTPASSAASTTFTMPADNVTVTATFSPILVSSLSLRAQQTGQSDKTGSDLTMNCYPKEGQTGGNDPLNHTLNVAFYEVLPADALDKTYDWSVRVKATNDADWTNVGFTGNTLDNNAIINSYNKSTGNLQIKASTGTAEIKITAHDGSGVTARVTITVSNVSISSISVDPTSMDVYAGQKKPVTITFSPANATDKAYTTGSYTYVTMRSSGSNPFYIEGNATNVVRNETVTVTSHDGSKTATIDVTVNPLPKATFIDIVHGKTDFLVEGESVLVDGTLTATVVNEGLDVDTEWHTPTHVDVADPGDGHNTCERQHLHLVGWILKDWADANPTATHSEIVNAGATNFYGANVAIDLSSASVNGKTYYAVWAKVVTP